MKKFLKQMNQIVILLCCILMVTAHPVFASQTPELLPCENLTSGATAELTLTMTWLDNDGVSHPVEGAKVKLYRVADLSIEHQSAVYTLTSGFASSGIDFTGMTASESLDAAEKLADIADSNGVKAAATLITDANGSATVSGLKPGMYLGTMKKAVKVTKKKAVIIVPTLWMAPMYELNADETGYVWQYQVTVQPKAAEMEKITPTPTKKPTKTPTPTGKPTTPRRVKTGDSSPIILYTVLAAAALLIIVLLMRRRKSK